MTDTKTITYEGRSYTVPVWVEWVTKDEYGAIYGHETKPDICGGVFCSPMSMFIAAYNSGWRDSLTKV